MCCNVCVCVLSVNKTETKSSIQLFKRYGFEIKCAGTEGANGSIHVSGSMKVNKCAVVCSLAISVTAPPCQQLESLAAGRLGPSRVHLR